jgi:hypothetical protein
MIIDLSRSVQNTKKIRSFLEKCIDLVEEKSEQIENEEFTCKKLEQEIKEEYLNLKFLETCKSIWNEYSNGDTHTHKKTLYKTLFSPFNFISSLKRVKSTFTSFWRATSCICQNMSQYLE